MQSVLVSLFMLSLIVRRHLVFDISYKRDLHLRRIVTAEHILDKVCFDLHLYLDGHQLEV